MSFHHKSRSLGIIVSLGTGLLVLALAISGSTASGGQGSPSRGAHQAFTQALVTDGVVPESVSTDGTGRSLQVVLNVRRGGSFGDAWAVMAAKREASYLAESGALKVDLIDVSVIDESGVCVWRAIEPVEPVERPVAATLSQEASRAFTDFVMGSAAEAGFDLAAVSLRGDKNLGLLAEIDVTVPTGPRGVDSAPRVVQDVLPLALDRMVDQSIPVDMAHLSVRNTDGSILVDYVIDPTNGIVMVWGAEGVEQVWAGSSPPAPSEAKIPQMP